MTAAVHRLLPALPVCIGHIEVGGQRRSTGSRVNTLWRTPKSQAIGSEPDALPFGDLHETSPAVVTQVSEAGASSVPQKVERFVTTSTPDCGTPWPGKPANTDKR